MKKGMLLSLVLISSAGCYGATKEEKQLFDAAGKGDVTKVRQLLDAGVDVNAGGLPLGQLNNGSSLMIAAKKGHVGVVELLLDRGADINAKSSLDKMTPLMWAAIGAQVEVVRLLLDRGADVNVKGIQGVTALSLTKLNKALTINAAKRKKYEETIKLLEDAQKKQK